MNLRTFWAKIIPSKVNVATGAIVPPAGAVTSVVTTNSGIPPMPPPPPLPLGIVGAGPGGATLPVSPAPTPALPTVTTDREGKFVIAPGDYKLFAWETLEAFKYFDPDLLERSETLGRAVHIEESSSIAVEVKVIPTGQ